MPASRNKLEKRRLEAFELHTAGLSLADIAKRIGISKTTAWSDIQAIRWAKAAQVGNNAGILRELEAARLDKLHAAVWPKAIAEGKPDYEAIREVLRIHDRRVALYGLDKPHGLST